MSYCGTGGKKDAKMKEKMNDCINNSNNNMVSFIVIIMIMF